MASAIPIVPSHSVGSISTLVIRRRSCNIVQLLTLCIDLGASLYEVLSHVQEDKEQHPQIDLHYDRAEPLAAPAVVVLPSNGLRLRFDGADQRLRLIEVVDFRKIKLSYKGSELVKSPSDAAPAFKRIYQIFGASYPGEYIPPSNGDQAGRYVLSWSGVAFTFPLQHSAWSAQKDHVSMLGSSAASPAVAMALFEGSSWPEARKDLFVRTPSGPRLSALAGRPKDNLPAEIELANITTEGTIEFQRRPPASLFSIVLNQTTPQDLITELGPPDVMHKRETDAARPEPPSHKRAGSMSRPMSNGRAHAGSQPSSYSSTGTDTFDTDFDSGDADEDPADRTSRETFWCYFAHGMDILVGPPSGHLPTDGPGRTPLAASSHLVVSKVIMHGNVPGSYAFNRHRRLRWTITLPNTPYLDGGLTSETKFEEVKATLMHIFHDVWPGSEMGRGKVVNRTWSGSPSDSSFFLPDAGEDLVEGGGSEQWLGNTRLYTFPGLVFEVLENGAVSALTVY